MFALKMIKNLKIQRPFWENICGLPFAFAKRNHFPIWEWHANCSSINARGQPIFQNQFSKSAFRQVPRQLLLLRPTADWLSRLWPSGLPFSELVNPADSKNIFPTLKNTNVHIGQKLENDKIPLSICQCLITQKWLQIRRAMSSKAPAFTGTIE